MFVKLWKPRLLANWAGRRSPLVKVSLIIRRDHRETDGDGRGKAPGQDPSALIEEVRADREAARRELQASASDRIRALEDRLAAQEDRNVSEIVREESVLDDLTETYRRTPGLFELEREIERARRTSKTFSLIFIDVDNLKYTNDSFGHAAGDQLLVDIVKTLRARVRPYDPIVRYGGDEFLCGLLDVGEDGARTRIAYVNSDLAVSENGHITAGVASLNDTETLEDLIQRADEDLLKHRQFRSSVSLTD
jgi:diguanylate cyclase (GGDEF)-like protein